MPQPPRTALVTGASSGIGEAFARRLAEEGYDLILAARSRAKLLALADALRTAQGRRVEIVVTDLAQPQAGQRLADAAAAFGMPVDLLVNNAGFGATGPFEQQDPKRMNEMLMLNCAAVVDLCRALIPGMLARGGGGIVNIASLAGFQPMPEMSVYAATKAFVLNFSLGLWDEYRSRRLPVVCVCPGPVDTPFFENAGASGTRDWVPGFAMADADGVARRALIGLRRRRPLVLTNRGSQLAILGGRLIPRRWVTRLVGTVLRA